MNGKKVRLIKHAQIEHQLPPYLGNHYFYLMTRSELPIGSSHQFVTSSNINNTRQQISQTVKQFPLTTPVLRSGITCHRSPEPFANRPIPDVKPSNSRVENSMSCRLLRIPAKYVGRHPPLMIPHTNKPHIRTLYLIRTRRD